MRAPTHAGSEGAAEPRVPNGHRLDGRRRSRRPTIDPGLTEDGDMHVKSLVVLKTAEPRDQAFRSVRLAPPYDAVTTRVSPHLAQDRMALKLSGKYYRLRRADFRALASTSGLRMSDTDAAIDTMLGSLREAVLAAVLPRLAGYGRGDENAVARMLDLCRERVASFR
jgi:serine/threonine-protein kinase HipA